MKCQPLTVTGYGGHGVHSFFPTAASFLKKATFPKRKQDTQPSQPLGHPWALLCSYHNPTAQQKPPDLKHGMEGFSALGAKKLDHIKIRSTRHLL